MRIGKTLCNSFNDARSRLRKNIGSNLNHNGHMRFDWLFDVISVRGAFGLSNPGLADDVLAISLFQFADVIFLHSRLGYTGSKPETRQ